MYQNHQHSALLSESLFSIAVLYFFLSWGSKKIWLIVHSLPVQSYLGFLKEDYNDNKQPGISKGRPQWQQASGTLTPHNFMFHQHHTNDFLRLFLKIKLLLILCLVAKKIQRKSHTDLPNSVFGSKKIKRTTHKSSSFLNLISSQNIKRTTHIVSSAL